MKHKLKQFLTTLAFTPISFVAIFLFSQLFYTCFNLTFLSIFLLIAVVCAWFLAKRFQIRWVSQILIFTIIPILSMLVLSSSLNCARCIGPGAIIKQAAGNIRSQAELYFNNNEDSYFGVCQDENINLLKGSIENQQIIVEQNCLGPLTKLFIPDFMAKSHVNCNDSTESYSLEAYLPTTENGTEFWCVDSTGFAGSINNSIGNNLKCE